MCSILFSGDGAWFYTNCKFLCLFLSGIYGSFFIYILLYNCLCHGPWACYWNKLNWNWNQYSRTTTCHTKIVLWWSPPEQHCETDEFQVWNKRLRKWWWWERKLVRNRRWLGRLSLIVCCWLACDVTATYMWLCHVIQVCVWRYLRELSDKAVMSRST